MPLNEPLALGTALILGASHALEADHLIAVASFVSRKPSRRLAAGFGFRWGVGHSITVVGLGGILLLLGVAIPERMEAGAEGLVGLMLIGIGAWAIRSSAKLSESPSTDSGGNDRHGITVVGLLHGLAGTGGVMALVPVAMADRAVIGVGYLAVFSVGLIGAMTLMAVLSATAVKRSLENSIRLGRAAARLIGITGIVVGCWWVVRAVG